MRIFAQDAGWNQVQNIALIADFDIAYLVASAELNFYGEDPMGDWDITQAGITRVGDAGRPTLLVQEGGYDAWAERLKNPATRRRLQSEMSTPTNDWDNLYLAAGSADKVLLVGFKNEALKAISEIWRRSPF